MYSFVISKIICRFWYYKLCASLLNLFLSVFYFIFEVIVNVVVFLIFRFSLRVFTRNIVDLFGVLILRPAAWMDLCITCDSV